MSGTREKKRALAAKKRREKSLAESQRLKPNRESINWVTTQALKRGMSYGMYVSLTEPRKERKAERIDPPSVCDDCLDRRYCTKGITCAKWRHGTMERIREIRLKFGADDINPCESCNVPDKTSCKCDKWMDWAGRQWKKEQRRFGVIR